MPSSKAPPNDGVEAPEFVPPQWSFREDTLPAVLEVAKRSHDQAKGGAKAAEEKASRLVQVALALLTLAVGLVLYGFNLVNDQRLWLIALIPAVSSVTFLSLAAFEAVEIDRVGIYHEPTASDFAELGAREVLSSLILEEEKGRWMAQWTSNRKHSDLMQAKAWFTRGLATLILSATLAGLISAGYKASADHREAVRIKVDRIHFPEPRLNLPDT